jgi:hypothetical protein
VARAGKAPTPLKEPLGFTGLRRSEPPLGGFMRPVRLRRTIPRSASGSLRGHLANALVRLKESVPGPGSRRRERREARGGAGVPAAGHEGESPTELSWISVPW